jgi:signal transduction histidine kinase
MKYPGMQRCYFRPVLVLIFFVFFLPVSQASQQPHPENGILDLRNEVINEKYVVRLNGEWEFYWKKLLRPHNFIDISPTEPDTFVRVPSYWTEAKIKGNSPEGHGFATYRLTILLPPGEKPALGLDVKVIDSSYDLYINGIFLGNNGAPGNNAVATVPGYSPAIYRFYATSDTVEILFNVANFHHRRGGIWLPVEFGSFKHIQSVAAKNFGRAISTVSVLVAFTFFFLFFFLIYPRDGTSLFFALTLFGLATRSLFTNQMLILLFADPGWQWMVRLEYVSLYATVVGAFWFLYYIYKAAYLRYSAIVASVVFSVLTIATLSLNVNTFSYFTFPSYLAVLVVCSNAIIFSSLNLLRNRGLLDAAYFAGFMILVYGSIHDTILALVNISGSGNYILSEVIILFILIQAGLLIYKWVASFLEKERLRQELENLNRDLEKIVQKRTTELFSAKNQAEDLSRQLRAQNQNLTETIQLKNKVFSVIAHDLRSPVVNILYILNLLKEEEYREKYESLAASCIQYSQLVINLLENMLVWGRGQEDSIRYSPDQHDLANIILTNMSIYKDTADRKDISVSFTQIGGTRAWFDKDLIDIVIRNLLSNAIKYTRRGGRISILVKEKADDQLVIKICDNGIGIPTEVIAKLQESVEVVSTPGTENEKGTGLGLKLCYELAKINRATIQVESRKDDGTCISINLPSTKNRAEKIQES